MDKYNQRGVSASKEEVHDAVKHLNHGLFPNAFCKIYPDYLGGKEQWCNVMSADGSGTKSILAYLYWKETGDLSVWKGIAQDAIVMNLDDLLCVGATGPFLLTSVINRNKHRIPGEVLAAIIDGTRQFCETMQQHGIEIHLTGGETADLGDIVRTITVDAAMTARMPLKQLVLTKNIQPGDVIIGLASYGQTTYEQTYNSGISSNGLTAARHDLLSKWYAQQFPETFENLLDESVVYTGGKRLTDELEGTNLNIGKALLSPTRTFAPFIKRVLQVMPDRIHGMINCTGGAQTKVLHYVNDLKLIKNNLLPVPPLFQAIQKESGTSWKEMYKVLNCGTRFEIYVEEKDADAVLKLAASFQIEAQRIGRVEAMNGKEVMLQTPHGNFVYSN